MHSTDATSNCSLKFTSSNNTREDIYTTEYYSAVKRNTFESALMRWMKLEPVIQSEVSQKKKYYMLMHIYGIYKNGIDEPMCREGMEMQMWRMDLWTQ